MGRAQRRQAERDQRKANQTQPTAAASARRSGVVDPRLGGDLGSAVPRQRGRDRVEPSAPVVFDPGVFRTTSLAQGAPAPRVPGVPHSAASPPTRERVAVRSLEVTAPGCDTLAEVEPQALGLTYWFAAAPQGEPYAVTVRFTGRLTARRGEPGDNDDCTGSTVFSVDETVDPVLPGSGRIALTTRVGDLAAGVWAVRAQVVATTEQARQARVGRAHARRPSVGSPGVTATGATGLAHGIRERAPGVRAGVWPTLVGVGTLVALGIQALLAARAGLPNSPVFALSVIACLVGLIGAKLYYLLQHPHDLRAGLRSGFCLQGFVLAAIATVVAGALIEGIGVGALVDVTAPGLAIGMAIGRVGCFFAGCCAGRPTASRWGQWSSNRRLGLRRIPVQLAESAGALLIGWAALLAMATITVHPSGAVFIAVIAAYTLARQWLFPWRDLPRKTALGRRLVTAVSVLALICAITLALLS